LKLRPATSQALRLIAHCTTSRWVRRLGLYVTGPTPVVSPSRRAAGQVRQLGGKLGEGRRSGTPGGLDASAEAVQQVAAGRVQQVVVGQLNSLDERRPTPDVEPRTEGHSDGTVQLDDRVGFEAVQLAVERRDLSPVGVREGGCRRR
jgi:hypothetical protein